MKQFVTVLTQFAKGELRSLSWLPSLRGRIFFLPEKPKCLQPNSELDLTTEHL